MIVQSPYKIFLFILLFTGSLQASVLKPGFEKQEYIDLLKISAQFMDSSFRNRPVAPENYSHILRGRKTGLDNRWDLWKRSDGVLVVSLRGTTRNAISWMENFYAAIVKAEGTVQID